MVFMGCLYGTDQPNSGFLLYYTTQSNLWCCLFFLYLMMTNRKRPWIKGGITATIIVTFILYQFIILPYCLKYGSMHQLFSSTDIAVHYLSPFLVVMDMILFDKNQDYSWYTISVVINLHHLFLHCWPYILSPTCSRTRASLSLFLFRYYRYWDSSFIHSIIGITLIFLVADTLFLIN